MKAKKLLSILAAVMIFTLLPTFALTAAAANGKTVNFGADVLEKYDCVYFGHYRYNSVDYLLKWNVIKTTGNNGTYTYAGSSVDGTNALFLLSSYAVDKGRFSSADVESWQDSTAREFLNDGFVSDAFSKSEKSAILNTSKDSGTAYALSDDKVFLLSSREAQNYMDESVLKNTKTLNGTAVSYWWLRTPYTTDGKTRCINKNGNSVGQNSTTTSIFYRPAMNVNKTKVVLTVPTTYTASNVGTLQSNGDYTGSTYKFIVTNSYYSFSIYESAVYATRNDTVTLHYSITNNAKGEDAVGYVSVLLVNSDDEILYYGQIEQVSGSSSTAASSMSFTLPSELADGTYTLKCFFEAPGVENETGYASEFEDLTLEVKTEKNLFLGTSALQGGQKSHVYFGSYKQSSDESGGYNTDPVRWGILNMKNGKALLLSDKVLDAKPYNETDTSITWAQSTLRTWLNQDDTSGFYGTAFTSGEKKAIALTTLKTDGNSSETAGSSVGGDDTDDHVFLLSIPETQTDDWFDSEHRWAIASDYTASKTGTYKNKHYSSTWWLRSPAVYQSYAEYVLDEAPNLGGNGMNVSGLNGVRPAFNLTASRVLFSTAAQGGKQTDSLGLLPNGERSGNDYRLTLKDTSRDFSVTEQATVGGSGETLTLHYADAVTSAEGNEYISAMLADEAGEILYYGQIAALIDESAASGTVDVTLPSELERGLYTLKLFNEQINGDYQTDVSSDFCDVSVLVGFEGEGTSANPYLIYNRHELAYFRKMVNSGSTDICGRLMDDIALNPGTFDINGNYTALESEMPEAWEPIGFVTIAFETDEATGWITSKEVTVAYTGTFDGNGKTISGLYYNNYSDYVGLFGYVSGNATIKNLNIENSYFYGSKYVGSVAGYIKPMPTENTENSSGVLVTKNLACVSVTDCHSDATVRAAENVGGLVGYVYLTDQDVTMLIDNAAFKLQGCTYSGKVTGTDNVGGLLGGADVSGGVAATVGACANSGQVNGSSNVGGILGSAKVTVVTTATKKNIPVPDPSTGKLTFKETTVTTSDSSSLAVSDCCNTAAVGGTESIGGIVGYAYLTYSSSTTSGILTMAGAPTDGVREITVSNSYNTGTVTGSTHTGAVTGYAIYDYGAVVGVQSLTTVNNCYYLVGTADAGMGYGTDQTVSKDTEAFVSGEVAYLLKAEQDGSVWGQTIGTDERPAFNDAKVYRDTYNDAYVYRNEIDGCKILRIDTDNKNATVVLDGGGTYTVVLARYTGKRLARVKITEITVTQAQAVLVEADGATFEKGDKVMLLKEANPLCEAFKVD